MVKRGEIKNISKVLDDVLSQKQFRIGIDNLKVQEAWIKTMGKNIQKSPRPGLSWIINIFLFIKF